MGKASAQGVRGELWISGAEWSRGEWSGSVDWSGIVWKGSLWGAVVSGRSAGASPASLGCIQFVVREEVSDCDWSLLWEATCGVDLWGEGVGTIVEH